MTKVHLRQKIGQEPKQTKTPVFYSDYPGLSIRSVHALEYCNLTLLQMLENKQQFKSNILLKNFIDKE